jgi:hypothetical protein
VNGVDQLRRISDLDGQLLAERLEHGFDLIEPGVGDPRYFAGAAGASPLMESATAFHPPPVCFR